MYPSIWDSRNWTRLEEKKEGREKGVSYVRQSVQYYTDRMGNSCYGAPGVPVPRGTFHSLSGTIFLVDLQLSGIGGYADMHRTMLV